MLVRERVMVAILADSEKSKSRDRPSASLADFTVTGIIMIPASLSRLSLIWKYKGRGETSLGQLRFVNPDTNSFELLTIVISCVSIL